MDSGGGSNGAARGTSSMQCFHKGDLAWDDWSLLRRGEVRAEKAAVAAARLSTPAGALTFAPPPPQ